MGTGLGGGQEAGAHPGCASASVQGRGQRGAGGDAAGGDHGHLDGRDDLPEQRGQRRRAPHMATGLDPLGDHRVAAGVDGGHRLVERADLPEGDRAAGMDALHHGGVRITPEHIDDAGATGRQLELPGSRRQLEGKEPDTDRPLRALLDPAQLLIDRHGEGR